MTSPVSVSGAVDCRTDVTSRPPAHLDRGERRSTGTCADQHAAGDTIRINRQGLDRYPGHARIGRKESQSQREEGCCERRRSDVLHGSLAYGG